MGTGGKGRKDTETMNERAAERDRKRRRHAAERPSRLMASMPYEVTGVPTDADGIERYMEARSHPLPLTPEELYEMNVIRPDRGPF